MEDRERTLDSPTDKIMLSLTAFADELEREKARQRTYDAMIRKARAGRGRRDLLKFAPSGKGLDAGAHDDIVVAMGLALEQLSSRARNLGAIVMEPMPWGCRQEQNGRFYDCYVNGSGMHVPSGLDALCRECEGHISTKRAHAAYVERTGDQIDLRMFVHSGLIRPNSWASTRGANMVIRRKLGY